MSAAHWTDGDRILITSYGVTRSDGVSRDQPWYGGEWETEDGPRVSKHRLAWFDLGTAASINVSVGAEPDYGQTLTERQTAATNAKGSAWNLIATGESGVSEVMPSINHRGDAIVYTTTEYSPNGHPDYTARTADLKVVPYNNRAGGTATPLAGASDPAYLEYYPSYSPDDAWIAFTRAPTPNAASPDGPYYNRFGEIDIILATGGTPIPIAANIPNACAGDDLTRGIINSWPKWAPNAISVRGKTYYFLVFSSARKYGDEFSQQFAIPLSDLNSFTGLNLSSQLYLAAVVVDDQTGEAQTYPALYIWNQNRLASGGVATNVQFSNLTPAWDAVALPPIEVEPFEPPH
jgi:hypothetical protein